MENSINRIDTSRSNDLVPSRDASLRASLGLVKELTEALMNELKSLDLGGRKRFGDGLDFNTEVRRFEVELIRRALYRTAGHQTRAAKLLGIKLTTLHDKIKRYDIDPHNLDAAWGTSREMH